MNIHPEVYMLKEWSIILYTACLYEFILWVMISDPGHAFEIIRFFSLSFNSLNISLKVVKKDQRSPKMISNTV